MIGRRLNARLPRRRVKRGAMVTGSTIIGRPRRGRIRMESAAATQPLVTDLRVVYLYVKDIERGKRFYRDVLGLTLEGDHDWVETTLPGGVRFALHLWHEGSAEPSSSGVNVDFEVPDIDAAAERLRDAGVEIGEIHREPFGSFFTFVDPEGYRLELFQPRAESS
jgi:predicted enzyme related to lactoylglutathione lyase